MNALRNNTTGNYNTASGVYALISNTTGKDNTASGFQALAKNTSGSRNAAIGANALYNNSTGSYNYALGWAALYRSTGSRNIAIGVNAGYALTSGNDNIYLGNNTGAAIESNTLRLGQAQTITSPVGIARTFIAGIAGRPISGSQVLINGLGQLGILASSSRYKEDIQDMKEEGQGLLKLRPVTFRYKEDAEKERQYGLIAEEVAKVYPDLVVRGATGEIESLQYHELIPLLLNEVQHHQRTLVELKAENQHLRVVQSQQLEGLKTENARLQAALLEQNIDVAARLARLEAAARTATVAGR